MKNELNRHKKSDRIKWGLTAAAFVLVAVLLVGLCLQVFGSGKVKPSEWVKKQDNIEQTMPAENTTTETEISITNLQVMTQAPPLALSLGTRNATLPSWWSEGANPGIHQQYGVISNIGDVADFANCFSLRCIENSDWTAYKMAFIFTVPEFNGYKVKDINVSIYTCGADIDSICPAFTSFNPNVDVTYGVFSSLDSHNLLCSLECAPLENNQYTCDEFLNPVLNAITLDMSNLDFLFNIEYDYVKKPVPLPDDPVKEGHTFTGWYYGTQAEHGENCIAYSGAPIYEDTALHAHFQINRYTIIYDSNGGSSCESVTVDWNTKPVLPTPVRVGYKFLGWFDGDTQYTDAPIKENRTLTAHWEIITFTVIFYVDGTTYDTLVVDYGTALVDVVEQANAQNLQVLSVRAQSGQTIQNTVTDNLEVQTQIMTGVDKVKNGIKQNWKTIALAAGGVVVLVLVISLLAGLTKKSHKIRR